MLIRPQAVVFVLGGVVVNRAHACDKFVHCLDGMEVGSSITCHAACFNVTGSGDYDCCTDPLDCNGFTGKVCADGSCSTKDGMVDPTCNQNDQDCIYAGACENATIPFVANSCVGPYSCKLAGNNGNVEI